MNTEKTRKRAGVDHRLEAHDGRPRLDGLEVRPQDRVELQLGDGGWYGMHLTVTAGEVRVVEVERGPNGHNVHRVSALPEGARLRWPLRRPRQGGSR